jgi:hypothetical protein
MLMRFMVASIKKARDELPDTLIRKEVWVLSPQGVLRLNERELLFGEASRTNETRMTASCQ